ncbi:MAG: S41 family peptidase [Pirellulales bacterium]|nr:S41 family peptidase [Pirellulales bacterium]
MIRQNFFWIVICLAVSVACYRTLPRNPHQRTFGEILDFIESDYVAPTDSEELFNQAVSSMLRQLDENSSYVPPRDARDFQNDLDNQYVGIGIEAAAAPDKQSLVVLSPPLVGTPAHQAGLRTGDQIVRVNGDAVGQLGPEAALAQIQGTPGTEVALGINRPGTTKLWELPIRREVIVRPSVTGYARNLAGEWSYAIEEAPRIGYLRINQFVQDRTPREVRAAFEQMRAAGCVAAVMDLRDNPGGYKDAAEQVCDFFLNKGELIVSTKGRNPKSNTATYATGQGQFTTLPLAILINHRSASASEIVAAALQDHQRAIIIGERSYGKGTTQHVIPLSPRANGETPMLRLTVAYYHSPLHRNIHRFPNAQDNTEWGVQPNPGCERPLTAEQWRTWQNWRSRHERWALGGEVAKPAPAVAADNPSASVEGKNTGDDSPALLGEDSPDPHLRQAVEMLEKKSEAASAKAA